MPIGIPASGAELALLADTDGTVPDADGTAPPGDSTLIFGPGSGELLISGPSLFAGYLPASVPPPDPFLVANGRRWYRTSDLAARDVDGVYHFRGRTDRRLKNRGFLVEPAEVEHTLAGHPGLGAAVVVVTEAEAETGPAMHAYVVPATGPGPAPTRQDLRTWLAERLPRYLWPAEIHLVDALPLGRTGKVDRTRLAASASGGGSEEVGRAEVSGAEARLADLAAIVLDCLRKLLVEDTERGPDTPLLGSDGVDSLVLVELVTACEQAGRTTLEPDLFVPATFATARTFATALATGRLPEGVGP
ncbi:phosphopantetheine-binding protein [Catenulispora yoronensis]